MGNPPFSARHVARSINPDTRSRRIASLEAQDQVLALRQQALEAELEQSIESSERVKGRMDRVSAVNDDTPGTDASALAAEQTQLQLRRREARADLDRVLAERRRVQEEWSQLTGLRAGR